MAHEKIWRQKLFYYSKVKVNSVRVASYQEREKQKNVILSRVSSGISSCLPISCKQRPTTPCTLHTHKFNTVIIAKRYQFWLQFCLWFLINPRLRPVAAVDNTPVSTHIQPPHPCLVLCPLLSISKIHWPYNFAISLWLNCERTNCMPRQ